MTPDPRIPAAVRNASLVGLKLVDAATADWAINACMAANEKPCSHAVVTPGSYIPPRTIAELRDMSIRAWAHARGISGAQVEDFTPLVKTARYTYRDAFEVVTRPRVPA